MTNKYKSLTPIDGFKHYFYVGQVKMSLENYIKNS